MKRQAFNLQTEIQKAWDWCWAYYCEPSIYENEQYNEKTGEYEKTGEKKELPPRQQWLTATDLERRIRAAAAESLEGKPYGSYGADAWGHRVRISTGQPAYGYGRTMSLLDTVRQWLQCNPKLTCHNFGRHHSSGARYRPIGVDKTEAEKETIKKNAKPYAEKLIHFADPQVRGGFYGAKSLCSRKARQTEAAKKRDYYGGRPSRTHTRTTKDAAMVTCPRCKKLLAEAANTLVAKETVNE